MKALYYFAEYQTPMYLWQRYHFIDELARHGCEVEILNPLMYESIDEANEKLLKKCRSGQYDVFMTPHNEEWIHTETVAEISRMGMPSILILFDSLMTPLRHRNVAPLFDLLMLSQKDESGIYSNYNSNILVSHYAANPYLFKLISVRSKPRICFPGTPYGSRADTINHLAERGVPIDLYFGGAEHKRAYELPQSSIADRFRTTATLLRTDVGRKVITGAMVGKLKGKSSGVVQNNSQIARFNAVSLEETNFIYASHDLSLSIATARNTGNLRNPIMIVHLRNFEIPMSGGVQFCQYFPELGECFEEDKEIIFYRSNEEMVEKAKYYLSSARQSERQRIRYAARLRAENEHTWFARFSRAFEYLGLRC